VQEKKLADMEARLAELEAAEKLDYITIRNLRKKIRLMKGRYNFTFMEMNDSIENEAKVFFDKRKTAYTMEKFASKCKQVKVNPELYKYYFNLEEKFLEEKYHVFNNAFLFHCIRYISNADAVKDEDEIKLVFNILTKLVYNKFPSEETREQALAGMRGYLDQLIALGLSEKFETSNTSQPKHPDRLAKERQRDLDLRNSFYDTLYKEFGNTFQRTDFDEFSTDEYREYALILISLKRDLQVDVTTEMFNLSLAELRQTEQERRTMIKAAEEAAKDVEIEDLGVIDSAAQALKSDNERFTEDVDEIDSTSQASQQRPGEDEEEVVAAPIEEDAKEISESISFSDEAESVEGE
jgi:hypothetical protein